MTGGTFKRHAKEEAKLKFYKVMRVYHFCMEMKRGVGLTKVTVKFEQSKLNFKLSKGIYQIKQN